MSDVIYDAPALFRRRHGPGAKANEVKLEHVERREEEVDRAWDAQTENLRGRAVRVWWWGGLKAEEMDVGRRVQVRRVGQK